MVGAEIELANLDPAVLLYTNSQPPVIADAATRRCGLVSLDPITEDSFCRVSSHRLIPSEREDGDRGASTPASLSPCSAVRTPTRGSVAPRTIIAVSSCVSALDGSDGLSTSP